jgi:hypothetical protein
MFRPLFPMLLTRQNVLHYLIHRGLVRTQDLVLSDVWISEHSHRNLSFSIRIEGKDGFFVKQTQDWNRDGNSTLAREAECYRILGLKPDAPIVPRYHDYDSRSRALVVGLAEPSESLVSFHIRTRRFPVPLATAVGRRLAGFHSELGKAIRFGSDLNPFLGQKPWVLTPDLLDRFGNDRQSLAQAKVIAIVQDFPDLFDRLKTLGEQWKVNGIIHGDMKFANILRLDAEEEEDSERIRTLFVDLELAEAGNVAWDVAGILQAYLSLWLQFTPLRQDTPLAQALASSSCPIESMQPAMRAFWNAYVATLELSVAQGAVLRLLATQYAAARLVQTAFEYMDERARISAQGVLHLQLSSNILAHPEEAMSQVLALS